MTDQPLFQDAERALRFAFSICETEIYNAPVYVKEIIRQTGRASKRAESMSPHDWHCQGAMIRAMVAKLDPIQAAYGFAAYSWAPDRVPAMDIVQAYAGNREPGLKNRVLLGLLVRRHIDRRCRHDIARAEIARQAGVAYSTAKSWEIRIGKLLDGLHWQFFDAIEARLADAGLIPTD